MSAALNENALAILKLDHVNVTVPRQFEAAAKKFYGSILALEQIPKPPGPRQSVGAWYQIGPVQLHLSVSEDEHASSDRHVCYLVQDVTLAERHLRDAGIEIIPDPRPMAGSKRFYVRDPGGNLIEIAGT